MPYILKSHRAELADSRVAQTPGELNYEISCLVDTYIRTQGLSYGSINDCLGALEGAKLEFYRRVSFYEQGKLETNGDVYSSLKGS